MRLLLGVAFGVLAVLTAAAVLYSWRHPDGAKQFEYAFGIAPPTGVGDVHAYRRYAGGPGDAFVLLRFTADPAAIDKTVAFRPLEPDPSVVDDTLRPNNDVRAFWQSIFGSYADYGGKIWEAPSELVSPEVYEWRGSHPKFTLVKLLWDAHTGNAFALYLIG